MDGAKERYQDESVCESDTMTDDLKAIAEKLETELSGQGPYLLRFDEPMARLTTFQLGGPCPFCLQTASPRVVVTARRFCREYGIPVRLMGGGSNILASDLGIGEGLIQYRTSIANSSACIEVRDETTVYVLGCCPFDALAAFCAERGYAEGVEASGIPGTVGGAVAGNAGAFGWQIGDNVVSVDLCDDEGNMLTYSRDECEFTYRHSCLRERRFAVLGVLLRFSRANPQQCCRRREEILALRHEKHPDLTRYPCAGSFFRNLEPTSAAGRRQAAGYFLEQVGAKAFREGGAGVFERHANIIVKLQATCRAMDVY
ncbi:MAG: FAD-binding protein, partial [Lentisphaerae bacterium]